MERFPSRQDPRYNAALQLFKASNDALLENDTLGVVRAFYHSGMYRHMSEPLLIVTIDACKSGKMASGEPPSAFETDLTATLMEASQAVRAVMETDPPVTGAATEMLEEFFNSVMLPQLGWWYQALIDSALIGLCCPDLVRIISTFVQLGLLETDGVLSVMDGAIAAALKVMGTVEQDITQRRKEWELGRRPV